MAKATRTINPLHFEDLEPHRFEDLVRQILRNFRNWQALEATGRGGADDGIDIRGVEQLALEGVETSVYPHQDWVIQCKRYKRMGPAQVREIVQDNLASQPEKPYGYMLVACCDFSKEAYDAFREEVSKCGLQDALIWGKAELEDQLKLERNRHLLHDYFGMTPGDLEPGADEIPPAPGEPPFKGLRYFNIADAPLFFGREELTARLIDRLRNNRLLAIVGASGSGKSSLVRAGVVAALDAGKLLADETKPPDGSQDWPVHIITPGAHPLENLAASLTQGEESVTATTTLMDDMLADPRSLHLYVRKCLSLEPTEPRHLLLVVDQFEETFTACRDPDEQKAFIANLLSAVADETAGPTKLILTLRADFYQHCAGYEGLRAAFETHQAYIGPMTLDELRTAIEGPAKANDWNFEPGLVDLMLRDVEDEPGGLPLLSHALLETWIRRQGRTLTIQGYEEAGGVRQAIARTADRVYQEMSTEQQAITRDIFVRLTELGEGTQDTRRRAALDELVPDSDQRTEVEAVLATLADARLVTTEEDTAEVSHEALIREWPTLREWLEENRDGIRVHRHLTEAANEWERMGKDPGELYRGGRLAQIWEMWQAGTLVLNELERNFLESSQAEKVRLEKIEEDARQRELEQLKKIADQQKNLADTRERSATRFKIMASGIASALILVIILAIFAWIQKNNAQDYADLSEQNAKTAESAKVAAEAEAFLRATEEAKALEQAAAAEAARAAAQTEAVERAAAQKEAEEQAKIAISRQLAAQSLSILDEPDLAMLLSVEAYNSADTFQARKSLFNTLAANPNLVRYIDPPLSSIREISFSPTGEMIAAGGNGLVWLYDLKDGKLVRQIETDGGQITQLVFSPDGTQLVTGSQDGDIILWDLEKGQIIEEVISDCSFQVGDMQYLADYWGEKIIFSPDGENLLFNVSFAICVWDLRQRESRVIHSDDVIHDQPSISTISFQSDNEFLEFNSYNRIVRIWDLNNSELVRQWSLSNTEFEDRIQSLSQYSWDYCVHPALDIIVVGSNLWDHDNISLWDLEDGELILEQDFFPLGQASVFSESRVEFPKINFNQNGDQLIYFGSVGAIHWDIQMALESEDNLGESSYLSGFGNIMDIAYSPDGESLATVTGDGDQILLCSIFDDAALYRFVESVHEISLEAYLFTLNPDGSIVTTVSCGERDLNSPECENSEVHLWKYDEDHLVEWFNYAQSDLIKAVVFSSDGSLFASVGCVREDWFEGACIQGEIQIWNVSDGVLVSKIASNDTGWERVAFSPNGEILAAGGCGELDGEAGCLGELSIWDVSSGELVAQISDQTGYVVDVAYSPDGKILVSASCGYRSMYALCSLGEIRLWNAVDYQSLREPIYAHLNWIENLEFNPDGSVLATTGCGALSLGMAYSYNCDRIETSLWHMPDGKMIGQPIFDFRGSYFTPDGRILIAMGYFEFLDVRNLQLMGGLPLPDYFSQLVGWGVRIEDIAFEGDGNMMIALAISYETDHQLLIQWNLDPYTWPSVACDVVGRNLDEDEWELYFPGETYRRTCPQWPDGDKRQELVVPKGTPDWRG